MEEAAVSRPTRQREREEEEGGNQAENKKDKRLGARSNAG